jgi:hypothetical protein
MFQPDSLLPVSDFGAKITILTSLINYESSAEDDRTQIDI